jgi:hypothetical protein
LLTFVFAYREVIKSYTDHHIGDNNTALIEVHRQRESTLGYFRSCIITFAHYCNIGLLQLASYSHLLNHLLAVALATTLPGAFIFLVGRFPRSWAAQHQNLIVNLLHLCLFLGFARQNFNFQESVVAALAMVSFDMFQRALDSDAKTTNESDHQLHASSAAETLVQLSCSAPPTVTESNSPTVSPQERSDSGVSTVKSVAEDSKEDIVRLQGSLTDLKTANKAKEVLLRRTREELKNARETLNETFAEYCALRDEIKNLKQNMARDHQAVVYRKDIELFALRKGNEQKEKYIKEHDAKLDEVFQQQKATVELKDAQLKMLKERLAFLDRQGSPKFGQDQEQEEEGDHALQVRLLRVKTAGNTTTFESPSVYEAKDATIVSLREQLAVAKKAADEVVNQQAELARAWDVVKNVQASLKEERKLHEQTREKLHEITVRLEEEQQKNGSSPVDRLPTIEEDKEELEAIFDTTQEDNVRLNAELEALEKRLREANSRMFDAEQEVVTLREQVQAEKAVSSDLETARPSVVHRVHFQRMEGQLKESQDALRVREKEVELLKNTLIGKNDYVKDLLAEVDAAVAFHTQDQDEIERLKQNMAELQATKDHLMRDHEHLAIQRTRTGTRQRVSSRERASARSSDATLITELSPPLPRSTEEAPQVEALPPVPAITDNERPSSIQETPKRHIRSESTPNRWSLMSNTAPPPELRGVRRRSLGLKDFMKKMVNREEKTNTTTDAAPRKSEDKPRKSEDKTTAEPPKPRTALSAKDKNTSIRPATAAPLSKTDEAIMHDPFFTGPLPAPVRPANVRRHTPRYYAGQDDVKEQKQEERPQTAMGSKDDSNVSKSLSRRSWGAAT